MEHLPDLIDIKHLTAELAARIHALPMPERVAALNLTRAALHQVSPFKGEPVDLVLWVPSAQVAANAYNPNTVAPPEMELLRRSISVDGYTQPIVGCAPDADGIREVVDGFHRHRVGKEYPGVSARIHGYLPLVEINADRSEKSDRMAATIRHNRARGAHRVEAMSDIVADLVKRNWTHEKIGKELGMDRDEVTRLAQLTGLAELFANEEFEIAWELVPGRNPSSHPYSESPPCPPPANGSNSSKKKPPNSTRPSTTPAST